MTLDEAREIVNPDLWPKGHPTQGELREYVKELRASSEGEHDLKMIEWYERYIEAMDVCSEHVLNSGEVIR